MPAPLIDWIVAEWIAARVAGAGAAPIPQVDLEPIVADAQARVVAYTGLALNGPIPRAEAISRAEWVKANLETTSLLMDPMLERAARELKSVTNASQLRLAAIGSAEVGILVGYLAKRVMGQYDLVLLRERAPERAPRLLFVMPNLGEAIKRFEADEHEFITWVALHEVTHAVQFGGVPWLQDHLGGLIRELMGHAEERMIKRRRLRIPSAKTVRRVASAARRADLVGVFASDEQRAILDRAQAVMAVIEGHAEHVMDAVAPELLPSLPALRRALDDRRKVQSPVGKLIIRLLGMELKLRQYERGKRFIDAIVDARGASAAQASLFSGPDALPTLAEIEDPAVWLRRVSAASG